MKKITSLLLLMLFLSCNVEKQETHQIERIISLAPSITEILYALDLDDKVVAVSDYCLYPEEANQKESVGGLFNPNLEKITLLKPDLILATQSSQQLREKVADTRIRVVLLPEKTVEDLYKSIDSIAALNGVQNRAKTLISSIKDSLAYYRTSTIKNPPRAILVLGRDPGTTNNIGISGPGAFINELWEYVGGVNAFPDMPGSFSQVNREDLLNRNPNIIIEFKSVNDGNIPNRDTVKKEWQNLNIDAVRNGNIYLINSVKYLIPGPRIYLLAREYFKILKDYRGLK